MIFKFNFHPIAYREEYFSGSSNLLEKPKEVENYRIIEFYSEHHKKIDYWIICFTVIIEKIIDCLINFILWDLKIKSI